MYTRTGRKKQETLLEKRTARWFSALDYRKTAYTPLCISYVYDNKGRLIEQRDPDDVVKSYGYDLNGNRTEFKLVKNGEMLENLCYTYDNHNRLTALASGGEILAEYVYDANGRRTNQVFVNGTVTEYAYNKAGLVTELVNKLVVGGENGESCETVLSSFSYSYSLDGRQVSKSDKDGVTTSYTYDLAGRLVKEETGKLEEVEPEELVTEPEGSEEEADGEPDETDGEENESGNEPQPPVFVVTSTIVYAYDGYGNRVSIDAAGFPKYSVAYTYDDANRLLSESKTEDSETKTTVHTYDANGSLIKSVRDNTETTTRAYDGFGKQVGYKKGGKEIFFRYRPDGLRHSKQVVEGSSSTVTTHVWDEEDIVLETNAAGHVKASYIRSDDQLVAQKIGAALSYYLHNAHGDVVQRVDSDGNILKSYNYDASGIFTSLNKNGSLPPTP